MFDRVLVANRGEIACRIFRTLRRLGIASVAVFSDADAGARHVHEADVAVRIGPAPARESYLNIAAILTAAAETGAQAIHPGYGFLAENPAFARACIDAGLTWIGPPPTAIEAMGDKISAKLLVAAAGVPVVPGRAEPGMTDDGLAAAARDIGWPVLVKPSAGGGGKGMHVVASESELVPTLARARREAAAAFGDDTLFVERFVASPRHIEVQVLADAHGGVIHLGERECSLQRRHQKVVEEAPSPLLDEATRARIGGAACETARSVGYAGAGTVEFIVSADAPGEFFFMEMNTRLQVEHPVTELVTGIDLVEAQLRVAAGEPLWLAQDTVTLAGHAVEARIYAEDPALGFLPTSGTVSVLREPAGDGVRVDSGLLAGQAVAPDYDPMLSKVIAHAGDRAGALHRLDAALADTVVLGVTTNIDFLRALITTPDVAAGRLDTELIDRLDLGFGPPPASAYAAAVLHQVATESRGPGPWDRRDGWRLGGVRAARTWRFRGMGDNAVVVRVTGDPGDAMLSVGTDEFAARVMSAGAESVELRIGDRDLTAMVARDGGTAWVHLEGGTWSLPAAPAPLLRGGPAGAGGRGLRRPMPGTVIAVAVARGERVEAGAAIAVVEAMKMEHTVAADVTGIVAEVLVAPGQAVAKDQPLARIDPEG